MSGIGIILACWLNGIFALPVAAVDAARQEPRPPVRDEAAVVVIKAGRIYTVAGEPIEKGIILIRGGRIEAVGRDVQVPADAKVIEAADGVVTPGLIDACCMPDFEIPEAAWRGVYGETRSAWWWTLADRGQRPPLGGQGEGSENEVGAGASFAPPPPLAEGSGEGTERELPPEVPLAAGPTPDVTWAEQASEVVPHRLVIDALNLTARDFARLAKGGVTTVYVSADSASVIGSRGAIVKTAGPLNQRVVRRADAVKASLGADPSDRGRSNVLPPSYGPPPTFHTRRPTTRMGVEWVFRKAFYDVRRARSGLPPYGADTPPAQAVPVLQEVLDGKIPLRIQARMQHDIFTALRLTGEFKLKFILEEATEAYRCLPQLKEADIPVVFGPLFMTPSGWRASTGEATHPRLNSPKQLAEAGIRFALTAQELRDEEGLVRQGMYAVRNGLSAQQALRAITATPAEFLGLAGQLGVVAPGAAADLVIWSTEPFDATSRPLVVLVDGRVVHDARE